MTVRQWISVRSVTWPLTVEPLLSVIVSTPPVNEVTVPAVSSLAGIVGEVLVEPAPAGGSAVPNVRTVARLA